MLSLSLSKLLSDYISDLKQSIAVFDLQQVYADAIFLLGMATMFVLYMPLHSTLAIFSMQNINPRTITLEYAVS